jgi:lysophospholipase L1-like esterase
MISNIFKVAVLVAATFLTSCAGEVCNCGKDESSSVYVEHPWAGGRIAYIGDSITSAGNTASTTKYWGFLERWLGTTSYVYAKSGREWNDVLNQAGKLESEHGYEVDAIMIFMGTNDFNAGVPIGEWYTEESAQVNVNGTMTMRTRRVPVMSGSTFCGRINMAMDGIKKMYPDKQIVLLTPIHRSHATFGDRNVQPTEDFQNCGGEYLDAYVDAVKKAGGIWAVPVIDLYSLSGLYPMIDEQLGYFASQSDRLHPNDKGQRRLALCLMYQLMTIPCVTASGVPM